MSLLVLVLLMVQAGSEWFPVSSVHGGVRPVYCEVNEAGEYHLVLRGDSLLTHYVFDSDGAERSMWITEAPEERWKTLFCSVEYPGGFAHSVTRVHGDDTLWTTEPLFFTHDGELSGFVKDCHRGGSLVVGDSGSRGSFTVFHLDSLGHQVLRCSLDVAGGPVIAVSDIDLLPGGGTVLTGVTDALGMNLFAFTAAFDGTGGMLFLVRDSLRFHASGTLVSTDGNGITVAGYTGSERDDGFFMPPADTDVFLARYDHRGTELWRTVVPLPEENRPVLLVTPSSESALLVVSCRRENGDSEERYTLVDFNLERTSP